MIAAPNRCLQNWGEPKLPTLSARVQLNPSELGQAALLVAWIATPVEQLLRRSQMPPLLIAVDAAAEEVDMVVRAVKSN